MDNLHKKFKPLVFYYFDTEGIEKLYSQTVNRLQTEITEGKEFENKGSILGKIGIDFFNFGNVGTEAKFSKSKKTNTEKKSIITTEHNLFLLIEHFSFSKNNKYFTNLGLAAAYCSQEKESVFININNKFDLPQFYSYKNPYDEINNSKYISFYIGPPLPNGAENQDFYSDDYFKTNRGYSFIMSTSLEKCPRIHNSVLMPNNHDAIFFRNFKGKEVPLNVFGYLTPLGSIGKTFQIKPYAIWIN